MIPWPFFLILINTLVRYSRKIACHLLCAREQTTNTTAQAVLYGQKYPNTWSLQAIHRLHISCTVHKVWIYGLSSTINGLFRCTMPWFHFWPCHLRNSWVWSSARWYDSYAFFKLALVFLLLLCATSEIYRRRIKRERERECVCVCVCVRVI